jgi:hypothetical protein
MPETYQLAAREPGAVRPVGASWTAAEHPLP